MKKVAEKVKMTGNNKVLSQDAWINNPADAIPRAIIICATKMGCWKSY